jgi:Uma2 family endonuclease
MIVRSTDIKNSFGKYLKLLDHEDIIIIRNGKPVARMTKQEDWDGNSSICEEAELYEGYGGIKMSYEEFMKMYENAKDRYEYIDGEAYLLASPKITHQKVLGNLYMLFRQWFNGKKCTPYLSPFDVTLKKGDNNMNVVQPDLLVVCDPDNRNSKDIYTGIPSLIVEILSNSSVGIDLIKKLDLYMRTGIREYWIVNYVTREVMVHEFKDNWIANMRTFTKKDRVKSFIFEGFTADIDEIFE